MPVNWGPDVHPTGQVPGQSAPIANRFLGRFDGNHPSGTTFNTGDWTIDVTTPGIWLCTAGGNPGTWTNAIASGTPSGPAGGALTGTYPNPTLNTAELLATAATLWAGAGVTGDSNARFTVGADGKLSWGPGSGATDTTLYRSGANALHTTSPFASDGIVSGSVGAGTTVQMGLVGPGGTSGITFEAAEAGSNLYRSGAGAMTIDGTLTVGGVSTGAGLKTSGITGAATAGRFVGFNASSSPASGTFIAGDVAGDLTGKLFVCTVGGTPGTWVQVGGSGGTAVKSGSAVGSGGGNIVTTSGTYATITGMSVAVAAATNDKLLCTLTVEDISDASAVTGYTFNFGAVTAQVRGASNPIGSVSGTAVSTMASFQWEYTTVAGDISGGNITVLGQWRQTGGSGNSTVRNGAAGVPVLTVVNLGPN